MAVVLVLLPFTGTNAGQSNQPALASKRIELRDQFNVPHRLDFPGTNLVLLVLADQKGAAQVPDWIRALEARYARRIEIFGLADLGGVPRWLRDSVRRSLRQTFVHPVMLDWTGKVAAAFGRPQQEAVVVLISPGGEILVRVNGPARAEAWKRICTVIDAVLPASIKEASQSPINPRPARQA